METKKIQVKDLKPGDLTLVRDGTPKYIKNIYDGSYDISFTVAHLFGKCVVLEYTDRYDKCNLNYTMPEIRNQLDYSCWTPSIFPINNFVDVVINNT